MALLYRHRIYCLVENTWVYLWKENETPLTVCPNDPGHAVQAESASIVDHVETGVVVLNKEVGVTTGGRPRVDAVVLSAPAQSTVSVDKIWDVDVATYNIRLAVTADCLGCSLTAEAAPLTVVGALTTDAPTGTTVLNVSSTAVAIATPGLVVTLQEGAATQELGVATAVDIGARTITVKNATTRDFSAAGPTMVMLTVRAADHIPLVLVGYLPFGDTLARAMVFPKGRPYRLTLTNPNLLPAQLVVYILYTY